MTATFVEAATILLREGFEAILVLAAMAAYLSRIGEHDRLTPLWLGAALAVIASVVAAWVFERFYNDAHNDIAEGILIFAAAALLFYVSGWLFLKQDPKAWQAYLKAQTDRALAARSGYVVGALAFLAVLREGAETILFLHVLAKTSGGWTASLIGGIAAAVLGLGIVFWIIINTTRRLPLRAVFLVTSLFLFLMGLKFVGEGLQELQEQALVPYDVADGAHWLEMVGLNPTWEALGAQLVIVLIALLNVAVMARHCRTPQS